MEAQRRGVEGVAPGIQRLAPFAAVGLRGRAADQRGSVTVEAARLQELARLELDEVEQLGRVQQVAHAEEHEHVGDAEGPRALQVLARLLARAGGGRDDQDDDVDLRQRLDGVLAAVGVAGAVPVDDPPPLGAVLDALAEERDVGEALAVVEQLLVGARLAGGDAGERGGERRLAVVHVADHADREGRQARRGGRGHRGQGSTGGSSAGRGVTWPSGHAEAEHRRGRVDAAGHAEAGHPRGAG
ncbi:hypothetical protein OV090_44055 [Nannocystis sp. RBIL2]|uniref:hypothetical protein n=1 Tax=Nannocystis sp. RBIL2 TaxID=2996788 RepID=UPI00226D6794|nr:hypothetical protein [Nannocystis sp. RBIL2]MCY1071800.1 hypothetical protein [Nannocystis sp. RBIL2]